MRTENFVVQEHLNIDMPTERDNLARVEVKKLGEKGNGLVAKKDFLEGEEVFVVNGQVINYATDYTIPISETDKIEPRISKTVAQYMNHSCNPNIAPDQENPRIYRAIRRIKKGEELVTNYAFLGYEFGSEKSLDGQNNLDLDLTCKCGSANCKGKMYGYKNMSPEESEKNKKFVLKFLLDEEKYPYISG